MQQGPSHFPVPGQLPDVVQVAPLFAFGCMVLLGMLLLTSRRVRTSLCGAAAANDASPPAPCHGSILCCWAVDAVDSGSAKLLQPQLATVDEETPPIHMERPPPPRRLSATDVMHRVLRHMCALPAGSVPFSLEAVGRAHEASAAVSERSAPPIEEREARWCEDEASLAAHLLASRSVADGFMWLPSTDASHHDERSAEGAR